MKRSVSGVRFPPSQPLNFSTPQLLSFRFQSWSLTSHQTRRYLPGTAKHGLFLWDEAEHRHQRARGARWHRRGFLSRRCVPGSASTCARRDLHTGRPILCVWGLERLVRNSGLRLQVTLLATGTVAREEFKCSPLFGVRCLLPLFSTSQLLFSLSALSRTSGIHHRAHREHSGGTLTF